VITLSQKDITLANLDQSSCALEILLEKSVYILEVKNYYRILIYYCNYFPFQGSIMLGIDNKKIIS